MNKPLNRIAILSIAFLFIASTFLLALMIIPRMDSSQLLSKIESSPLGENNRESQTFLMSLINEDKNSNAKYFANALDQYFNALVAGEENEVKEFAIVQQQSHLKNMSVGLPSIEKIFISSINEMPNAKMNDSSSPYYIVTYATISGWIPTINYHTEVWYMQGGKWVAAGPDSPWLGDFSLLSIARLF